VDFPLLRLTFTGHPPSGFGVISAFWNSVLLGTSPRFQLSRTFIPACFGRYRGMAFFVVGEVRLSNDN
jgi:hypothetical protein